MLLLYINPQLSVLCTEVIHWTICKVCFLIFRSLPQDSTVDNGALDVDITSTSSAVKDFFKLLPNPL